MPSEQSVPPPRALPVVGATRTEGLLCLKEALLGSLMVMGGWLQELVGLGALLLLLLALFPQGGTTAPKTKEEKTLQDLVGVLQEMVKYIPTEEPSQSVTVDTVWKKLKSTNGGGQTEASQATDLPNEITREFLKSRSDASASVILHSDTIAIEKTTPEDHQSETSASVLYTDFSTLQKPLASDTTTAVKTKSFDQLTNGALSSLVESLKNVEKSHDTLHKSMNKLQQESNNEKNPEEHLYKPVGGDIIDMIDMLIKTIKNTPNAVKNHPAFHIEKAESFLKDSLEMTGEAEKQLMQSKEKKQEKVESLPIAVIQPVLEGTIRATIPSESQEKKAEEQKEMKKIKSLVYELYGVSPQKRKKNFLKKHI
ncbi:hypothetical protein JRQ81_006812 [Phrynocephalus forsythii]|uniref:Sperm equatorial segment protein 1 n=1 Tax=Phrynocephalus forsythii TaxID=171643 RepID=A0A9Q0XDX0_9SAUR|nr:hypothetical protein JRQ81_006812 [Phrynocephalus forsythii]